MNAVESWVNYRPFSFVERQQIDAICANEYSVSENLDDWLRLEAKFKSLFFVDPSYKVGFANYERDLIAQLFDLYVDDSTLVVTTDHEHETVKQHLAKCKNVHYINLKQLRLNFESEIQRLVSALNSYRRVFVYIIHVSNDGLYTTPYFLHQRLFDLTLNKQRILVLDDAQGMYLTRANYSLFDYVLSTAHAFTTPYLLGIVLKKRDDNVGVRDSRALTNYLTLLTSALSRVDKIFMLQQVLRFTFPQAKFCVTPDFRCTFDLCLPDAKSEVLKEYGLPVISPTESYHKRFAFRSPIYLYEPQRLINGVSMLQELL